jgi:outer membrane receptor protein involved in Fe transport
MFKNTKINLLLASLFSVASYAADLTTDKIEVISTTPLGGIGLPANQIPSNIQVIKSQQINKEVGVSVADYLNSNAQGININTTQGNPFQPDISFHGFTASPLVGNPQGMSVYVDGVRVNEPFGDVVQWDLIPNFSIKTMQVVPGSNPVYGLNTLGGAIAIETKGGRQQNGMSLEGEAGSWGRKRALVEYGGVSKDGAFDYYFGGQSLEEDGWRKYSPSRVNQTFGKVGWQNSASNLNLSYTGVDDSLTGNGLTPVRFLSGDNDQIHTRPDITKNYMHNLTLNASNWINDNTMVSMNAYYRKSNRNSVNGDLNGEFNGPADQYEFFADATRPKGANNLYWNDTSATGYPVYVNSAGNNSATKASGQTPNDTNVQHQIADNGTNYILEKRPSTSAYAYSARFSNLLADTNAGKSPLSYANWAAALDGANSYATAKTGASLICQTLFGSADYCAPASMNRSTTKQRGTGLNLQVAFNQDLFGKKNLLTTGLGYDESKIKYRASEQKSNVEGFSFSQIGSGTWFGPDGLPINLGEEEETVNLVGKTKTFNIFATDTMSINDKWHVTLATRYNNTQVHNTDNLNGDTAANSLSGKHRFDRINPSLGLVFEPIKTFNVFGNYSESSRAPTSTELGCANPAQPCLLPNAMAGDPPLEQVVAKTFEGGLRGKIGSSFDWVVDAYHTQNSNDIQFISATSTGSRGYFKNVGDTERQGFDVAVRTKIYEKLTVAGSYSYIDASYDDQFTMMSPNNSSASGTTGAITVKPGNQLPGISPHQLKLRLDYAVLPQWNVGANIVTYSSQYVFGNENNAQTSSQSNTAGLETKIFGKLAGYTTVNLDTQYNFGNGLSFFAKAINVFDRDYYAAGRLIESHIGSNGWQGLNELKSTGVVPGSPRAAWLGFRYDFGGSKNKD